MLIVMRVFSCIAAIACAGIPISAQAVGTPQSPTDVVAVSKVPTQVSNPYTIRIYYGDSSTVKHVLAVGDEEKQQSIIDTLQNGGAQPDGDWYLCPTTDIVEVAKNNARDYGGVIYDLLTTAGAPLIAPYVELTNVEWRDPQRLYAFALADLRDDFREYVDQQGFAIDGDWTVAPNDDTDSDALYGSDFNGVASIFSLSAETT